MMRMMMMINLFFERIKLVHAVGIRTKSVNKGLARKEKA